jgi:hypothetical protein
MRHILGILVIISFLTSCDSNRVDKINELIGSIKTLPIMKDTDIIRGAEAPSIETIDGIKYKCKSVPKSLSATLLTSVAFNPNTGVLFPGSVVKGNSLKDGVLNDIAVKRNAGYLTISYKDNQDKEHSYTDTVKEANFQNVQDAVMKLTDRLPDGNQVARISFEKTESHELEETFLRLGISAKWMSGSAKANLEKNFSSNKSKYFVKVVQPYYDISFQTKYDKSQQPSDFFSSDVSSADILKAMTDTANNPPAYVKSISYGRMLLLLIESDASQKDLTAGLEATFSGTSASGKIELSVGQKTAINNSKINMIALGGSSEAVIKILTGNKLDSLNTYLKEGANFSKKSPAFPITYVTSYLKTNEVAKLSFTTNYADKTCIVNPKEIDFFAVTFSGISDDKDKEETITYQILKGDNVVGQNTGVGAGQSWGGEWYEEVFLNEPVDEFDRDVLKVIVEKSNGCGSGDGLGCGFEFSRHSVYAHFKGDPKSKLTIWYDYNKKFKLGNGDSRTMTLPLKQ